MALEALIAVSQFSLVGEIYVGSKSSPRQAHIKTRAPDANIVQRDRMPEGTVGK